LIFREATTVPNLDRRNTWQDKNLGFSECKSRNLDGEDFKCTKKKKKKKKAEGEFWYESNRLKFV
jgi:hypothetical protein